MRPNVMPKRQRRTREKETEKEADQTGQCEHVAHRAVPACKRNGNSKYNNFSGKPQQR